MKASKAILILIASGLVLCCGCRPEGGMSKKEIISAKNFPLCHELNRNKTLSDLLSADPTLSSLSLTAFESFRNAASEEEAIHAALLSEPEIGTVSDCLASLSGNPSVEALCKKLKTSGKYLIYNDLPDGEFLRKAWKQDAEGINRTIRTYALGEKPVYPKIDSMSIIPGIRYFDRCRHSLRESILCIADGKNICSLPLETAFGFLNINGRDEAADLEPLDGTVNRQALRSVRKTQWDKYPYPLILALGHGPEDPGEEISPNGVIVCSYAAELYKEGKAPFIVVSGGRVHPYKTRFIEAAEMKRQLIETYGIPESAIIMEPHARHTHTNIRNTGRLMIRYGIPMDRPVLITSCDWHLDFIQTERFDSISTNLMIIKSFEQGKRISGTRIGCLILPSCTQVSPIDPLDP